MTTQKEDYKNIPVFNALATDKHDTAQDANNQQVALIFLRIETLLIDIDRRLTKAGL
jgi:hypothetical protein